ncbi:MAG: response regulator [Campylobacterales bacterium]|nr:response regulator [Campylobacterales bacterium]
MSKLNILVAEEKSVNSKNLKNYLKYANGGGEYNVFFAHTIEIALSYIQNQPFDLVITDIHLGHTHLTGIDLVKKLNQTKNIPVIYLTDSDDDDDEVLESIAQTNHSYFLSCQTNC